MPDPLQAVMREAKAWIEATTCAVPGCGWAGSVELLTLNHGVCPEHRERELAATSHLRAAPRAWYGDSLDELEAANEREGRRVERGLPAQPWEDSLPADANHGAQYGLTEHGTRYGLGALRREVAAVRATKEGNRTMTLRSSAFSIGRRVGEGHLDAGYAEHELTEAGLAVGLKRREVARIVRTGIERGAENPRS